MEKTVNGVNIINCAKSKRLADTYASKTIIMKVHYLIFFVCLPLLTFSQNIRSMSDVESRKEAAMSEVTGKTSGGVYRYYLKGESAPFTGILYARYDNGNYASWQEYVDGVGEGTWINYYQNGNYKEVGTYRQNRVEGPIKKYH